MSKALAAIYQAATSMVRSARLVIPVEEGTPNTLRIVCLSDTHNLHNRITIPPGDVLIHAGDFSGMGAEHEITDFARFLRGLPHKHKVVIAGNHDFMFEKHRERAQKILEGEGEHNVIYLQDSSVTIGGVKIYGSPWQPRFFDWAFNLDRGQDIKKKWDLIPSDTDILVTHGPPKGYLDRVDSETVGCEELILAIERVKPKAHIFGHIHEGYGTAHNAHTLFINASNCNHNYRPINAPIYFDITPKT